MLVSVGIFVYEFRGFATLGKLEAIAGYHHQVLICDLPEGSVEDCSLVVDTHSKINLIHHLLDYCLSDHEASVADKIGDVGKVTSRESTHFMRGFSAENASDHLLIHAEGNLFTFQCKHHLDHGGSYRVAYRMFPKNVNLPHRQDFCYVRWFV
jgi:hypothetical protein